MTLPTLFRWHRGRRVPVRREASPASTDWVLAPWDRLFEDFWRGLDVAPFGASEGGFAPQVEVTETEKEVRVSAELPGLEPKDFQIELDGDALVLKGEKRVEHEDRKRGYSERAYGAFERVIPLPCEVDADAVKAEYKNGILTVTLPKRAEATERTRRIEVKAG